MCFHLVNVDPVKSENDRKGSKGKESFSDITVDFIYNNIFPVFQ